MWNKTQKKKINHGGTEGTENEGRINFAALIFLCALCVLCGQILGQPMNPTLHVVLVEPEIPPNTGNVARLCLAVGARLHLVGPLGFSLDEKALRRAGMDYWKECDVRLWDSFETLRAEAGEGTRFWFFTTKAKRGLWEGEFQKGDWLVFGRESKGLPESLLHANAESCLRIPMRSEARSLNLATSVGIGVFEALRQVGY
jgi:tRNA (cytidine/uridine-2'-O-)-methyltransferase